MALIGWLWITSRALVDVRDVTHRNASVVHGLSLSDDQITFNSNDNDNKWKIHSYFYNNLGFLRYTCTGGHK